MSSIQEKIERIEKPITVPPSPWLPMLGVFLRQVGLIGGSITTLFSLLSNRDLRGIFDYIRGEEFLTFITVLVGLSCLLWGLIREWRLWKKLCIMASNLPDELAAVARRWVDAIRGRS